MVQEGPQYIAKPLQLYGCEWLKDPNSYFFTTGLHPICHADKWQQGDTSGIRQAEGSVTTTSTAKHYFPWTPY